VTPAGNEASWLRQYQPAGAYDEMLNERGDCRPAWRGLADKLGRLNAEGMARRSEQVQRLLRESGVTYNVHGAPRGPERSWELDPLPLLFAPEEWQSLAAGLTQRAWLLDQIAADVYGPQTLLQAGLLPPEIVLGHPSFLLPCHGIRPAQDVYLHLCAAHLARGPDGNWVALADRTQGPSGAGYAVENRILISRTLPDEFHSLRVERLAGFFLQLREMFWSLSPRPLDQPRVVLLSPGPRSPTYFEDAYLARYLGFTLAEGEDLTVRGTSVFLKTLGGLQPIDVIWRRLADEDCDPLELRSDSWLGVTGLLQAVRSGQVSIANALGSGWLESPALMAFLPGICRHYLGDDLKLPSVPTWWCAAPGSLAEVESVFDECVIRPTIQTRTTKPLVTSELTAQQRAELWSRIQAEPERFVAQRLLTRSTAPVWQAGRLQPWHVGLRTFVAWTGENYEALPGGLSRVSSDPLGLGEGIAAGQGSKDVWVLSDRPVAPVTLLKGPGTAVELQRTGNDVPSRVVENVYWLARGIERSEHIARHVRSVVTRLTGENEVDDRIEIQLLVAALVQSRDEPVPTIAQSEHVAAESFQRECVRYIFDGNVAGSLGQALQSSRRTANAVRDRLSLDAWRIINQLDLNIWYPWPPEQARPSDLFLVLNQTLSTLLAIGGLVNENMTRGPVWRFWEIGRRLERAVNLLRLVRRTLVPPCSELGPLLEVLLEIGDSTMTYRQRYLTSLQLSPVLDLLLLDESNPRSVAYQVRSLGDHFTAFRGAGVRPSERVEQQLIADASRTLRLVDADGLAEPDAEGWRAGLDRFLASLLLTLRELSERVNEAYFAHTTRARHLGS